MPYRWSIYKVIRKKKKIKAMEQKKRNIKREILTGIPDRVVDVDYHKKISWPMSTHTHAMIHI